MRKSSISWPRSVYEMAMGYSEEYEIGQSIRSDSMIWSETSIRARCIVHMDTRHNSLWVDSARA